MLIFYYCYNCPSPLSTLGPNTLTYQLGPLMPDANWNLAIATACARGPSQFLHKNVMSFHVQDMPKLASSSHLTLSANAKHMQNASRSSRNVGHSSGYSARLSCQGHAGASQGGWCQAKAAELPMSFTYHTTSTPDSITSRKAAMWRPACTQPVGLGTIDLDISLAASDGGAGLCTGDEQMTGVAEQVRALHYHLHLR